MHAHVLHTFAYVSAASAASPAPTQPSMKESTKGGGRRRRPPPFVEAARSAASFMDGFVEAKEAAGAAQTHVNLGKTCTCMHILRATSDPQGHHERAHRTGGQARLCFHDNKKDVQRPYDRFCRRYRAEISAMRPKTNDFLFTKHPLPNGFHHGLET